MSESFSKRTLTSQEAAVYIGMSESWLRQSRMDSAEFSEIPPFVKIGRAVRYLRSDLDDWLYTHRVTKEA